MRPRSSQACSPPPRARRAARALPRLFEIGRRYFRGEAARATRSRRWAWCWLARRRRAAGPQPSRRASMLTTPRPRRWRCSMPPGHRSPTFRSWALTVWGRGRSSTPVSRPRCRSAPGPCSPASARYIPPRSRPSTSTGRSWRSNCSSMRSRHARMRSSPARPTPRPRSSRHSDFAFLVPAELAAGDLVARGSRRGQAASWPLRSLTSSPARACPKAEIGGTKSRFSPATRALPIARSRRFGQGVAGAARGRELRG